MLKLVETDEVQHQFAFKSLQLTYWVPDLGADVPELSSFIDDRSLSIYLAKGQLYIDRECDDSTCDKDFHRLEDFPDDLPLRILVSAINQEEKEFAEKQEQFDKEKRHHESNIAHRRKRFDEEIKAK